LRTFTPKFDVKEIKDAYELHGELPGIDQKDIEIEFTDANTLTVKGRIERKYESGPRPAGLEAKGAITEEAHKATVEDESAEPAATEVAKKDTKPSAVAHHKKEHEEKYWVSERSVGEFSRSFSFPVRVDQDGVQASMKNGILSILVPKAKKQASKKIAIQ
jgi:HSP20 family molecular chaperone IbpA